MVKGYVKSNNTTFKIDNVRALLIAGIERVTDENWKNFIRHVITEEDKIWQVDTIISKCKYFDDYYKRSFINILC